MITLVVGPELNLVLVATADWPFALQPWLMRSALPWPKHYIYTHWPHFWCSSALIEAFVYRSPVTQPVCMSVCPSLSKLCCLHSFLPQYSRTVYTSIVLPVSLLQMHTQTNVCGQQALTDASHSNVITHCIISRFVECDMKQISFSPFADVRVWMFVLMWNDRNMSLWCSDLTHMV